MKIAFFGLTGMGNSVLSALVSAGLRPIHIVTRKEKERYPYYPTPHLSKLANDLSIPCSTSSEYRKETKDCDVIVVATFHKVLSSNFLASFKYKFNIHPSLLPLYRGPNPFYWVIRNQEQETGISIHELGGAIDEGPIFWQRTIAIHDQETQGSLRLRLSNLAGQGIIDVLDKLGTSELEKIPQADVTSSYFSRPTKNDFYIDFSQNATEVSSKIRAVIPYPGFVIDGQAITNVRLLPSPSSGFTPGAIVRTNENFYIVATNTQLISLEFTR